MKKLKDGHRSDKKPNDIPRSATFSTRKGYGIPEHFTASIQDKKKRR